MMLAALLAATLAQGYYSPDEALSLYAQASDSYSKEDYAAAAEGFQKLLDHGFGGPDVLFSLGTARLAEGKLGEAVLSLERARRLKGGEDIEANLAVARSRQLDQVVGEKASEPFLERVVLATREPLVSWGFLCSWLLAFGLLFAAGRVGTYRTLLRVGAAVSLLVALGAGLVVLAHVEVATSRGEGVVVAHELKARELPREAAKVAFEVHEGLLVRVLERSGRFLRIQLPNGLEGWAEREGVTEL